MSLTTIRSFLPIEKLGEGSFASVYKVQRISDRKIYALKKIKMGRLPRKARENSLNEVRFLASFDSPYITKYYEAFFDQDLDVLCIVMEYAAEGDLRKKISSYQKERRLITEIEIWKAMLHILHGLKALHDQKILHRDIKCENIMIAEGKYKIGDMNVSKINKEGFVDTQTGTPYYASPEVWKDEPYNQKSDIWSLGCILYEMAVLRPPFTGNSMEDLYKCVLKGRHSPIPKCYSNELAAIVSQCLQVNPAQRPSASQLLINKSVRIYENICMDNIENKIKVAMLQTINLPKNMKLLNQCLPKSNYQTIRQVKEEEIHSDFVKQVNEKVICKAEPIVNTCTEPKTVTEVQQSGQNKDINNVPDEISRKASCIQTQNCSPYKDSQRMRLKSYSKKVQSVRKQRRVLRQLEKQANQHRSRSRSLPRTEKKSMSLSKELGKETPTKPIIAINSESSSKKQSQENTTAKKEAHNHHWNIVSQAKKYLQRGLHRPKKLF